MIGKKVICVDDNFSTVIGELTQQAGGYKITLPKKDDEYVIRAVFDNAVIGEPSYLLEGVFNPFFKIPLTKEIRELSFAHWRFREIKSAVAVYDEEFDNVMEELFKQVEKQAA